MSGHTSYNASWRLWLVALMLVMACAITIPVSADETSSGDAPVSPDVPPTTALTESPLVTFEEGPNYLSDLEALVITNKGNFTITFLPDLAPLHALNFIALAKAGFFDGLTFHRYVEGFVVQGGDPMGNGTGGPGYVLPAEIYEMPLHLKGSVGMARTGDEINPERYSSGSQFYICLDDVPRLDGKYTVWGNVTKGMDIVMELRADDIIEHVFIAKVSDDFEKGIATLMEERAEEEDDGEG